MEKAFEIKEEYLYLPIQVKEETQMLEIFSEQEEKLFEFQIPVGKIEAGKYPADYFARFPVKKFTDKTLILRGDMPNEFFEEIRNECFPNSSKEVRHPSIHFTPETGWLNDPNGLVYKDGIYHLYFQYNPFDVQWQNMSWGHAVSEDLLHWHQEDTVLFPDEEGMMFSGSGIVNKKALLGLPEDALLFFYTAAGSANKWSEGLRFSQHVAYSLDNGKTLTKLGARGALKSMCQEERDPKVFWHEESSSYIMVLWLEEHDFGIFRSADLEEWKQTDRLTLENAFECPDLIKVSDEQGKEYWAFWCADGFYFWGEFDGYSFKTDGKCHKAYMNHVLYAAQTYSNVDGRVVQIPWFRIPNNGEMYTGAMGIPREISVSYYNGERRLALKPVRELKQWYDKKNEDVQVKISTVKCDENKSEYHWKIEGCDIFYQQENGVFGVNEEQCVIPTGIKEFSFLRDDYIFEVTADCGIMIGVFMLNDSGRR